MKKKLIFNILNEVAITLIIILIFVQIPYDTEKIRGFWDGIWNGLTIIPAFIVNIVWNKIEVYAVNNNGFWYGFGYLIGILFESFVILGFFYINDDE